MKDVAQDLTVEMLCAAKDGGVEVFILARFVRRHHKVVEFAPKTRVPPPRST